MKIQTKELTGAALDWAVATCDGYSNLRVGAFSSVLVMDPPRVEYGAVSLSSLNYSTDWAQGGPLKEREGIVSGPSIHGMFFAFKSGVTSAFGPAELVAAMRCLVAVKLGDVIEVPDELA